MTRKGEVLTHYLESKIACGRFGPGEKLPSLRQWMTKFNLSMNTARRAVEQLAEKGLVEFRHGSGVFVALRRGMPRPAVILAVTVPLNGYELDSVSGLALAGVRDAVREAEAEVEFRHLGLPGGDCSDAALERLTAEAHGLILIGGYDAFLERPRLRLAAAGVGMHRSFEGMFSPVDLDPFRAAELAAGFFHDCPKLVVVTHPRANIEKRLQAFLELRQEGIVAFPEQRVGEFSPDCGYLYLCGSDAMTEALEYEARTGRPLAPATRLLAIDGKPMFLRDPGPGFPTVAINWRQAGRAAFDECLRRITYPGTAARRIYLSPELYR